MRLRSKLFRNTKYVLRRVLFFSVNAGLTAEKLPQVGDIRSGPPHPLSKAGWQVISLLGCKYGATIYQSVLNESIKYGAN